MFSTLFHLYLPIVEYSQTLLPSAAVVHSEPERHIDTRSELLVSRVIKHAVQGGTCVFHLTAQAYVHCFIFVNPCPCASTWTCTSLNHHMCVPLPNPVLCFQPDSFMFRCSLQRVVLHAPRDVEGVDKVLTSLQECRCIFLPMLFCSLTMSCMYDCSMVYVGLQSVFG